MKPTLKDHATFQYVSQINRDRCNHWHPNGLYSWSPADWAMATVGEFGELCNVLKKLRRLEDGAERVGRGTEEELLAQVATEIGDTFVYLDLLCQRMDMDMYTCVAGTFNRVSEREGLSHRLI